MYKNVIKITAISLAVLLSITIICIIFFNNSTKVNSTELSADNAASLISQADLSAKMYDYDKAIDIVNNSQNIKQDMKNSKISEYQLQKEALVKYEGDIYHIFFHSLIVYPELAFDGDYKAEGYNLWMTTVNEFKSMLPKLYERGYVLYDIKDLMQKDSQGNIVKKDVYLPSGKKPLILSVDDVCYYDYMKGDGFASKLVLDDKGEVATLVETPQKEMIVTYDGDVFPIVDSFVKEHPDFSYKGNKGLLAVTGYEGVLGYRITDVTGDDYNKLVAEVTPVIERLKATGWSFTSHSYTHNNYFKTKTITMSELDSDSTRWKNKVESVIGDTNIYISPFGVFFDQNDPRYKRLLHEYGFNIYCYVGLSGSPKYYNDNMWMGRIALDGLSLVNNKTMIRDRFFDPDAVIDPMRPPLK